MAEQTDAKPVAVPDRALASARAFVAEHGKPARAVVENIGRAGSRVVLVGDDGALGDVLVSGPDVADALVAAVEDLNAASWDADTTAATTIGPERRRRMGASVLRR